MNLRKLFGLHEKVEAVRQSNKRLISQSEEEIKERKELDTRLAAISNELRIIAARRQSRPRAQS